MSRFDRIYVLDRLLRQARRPVSSQILAEKMECSRATLFRTLEDLRNHLNAPVVYDRAHKGYHYDESQDTQQYELPGLWFNPSELYGLLVIQHLLANIRPGLLERDLAPLRSRIEQILEKEGFDQTEIADRVRILHIAARPAGEHFPSVADALIRRRRLHLHYHGRERDTITERDISPQRLIHYRDNWYLDAWCHQRKGLRSFAVDRIRKCRILDQGARDVGAQSLKQHFAAAYGIFSGKASRVARLHFTPHAARWVADERWHPEQEGQYLANGGYELHVPYGDHRELIGDILRFGPEVEVIGPESLRKAVVGRLQEAARLYG